MTAIKCPACGDPIPLEPGSPGRVVCPGCGKGFALKKKPAAAAAGAGAGSTPASAPALASAAAPDAAASVQEGPARAAPRRPGGPVRPVLGKRPGGPVHKRVIVSPEPGVEGLEEEGERPTGWAALPREKKLLYVGGPLGALAGLLVIFLVVRGLMNAAAERDRAWAQEVLKRIALKWQLEANAVKEAEAAWASLRSPENATHLADVGTEPERRELGLRLWLYKMKREKDRTNLLKAADFLTSLNYETNKLLYDKGAEMGIDKEDLTLDWLAWRGYRILENLKATGAAPEVSAGAEIDASASPGTLRMKVFGRPLEADFDPSQSSIDTDSGVVQAAFQTNYTALVGGSPSTIRPVYLRTRSGYVLDYRKEVEEFLGSGGKWASRAFQPGQPPAGPEAAPGS